MALVDETDQFRHQRLGVLLNIFEKLRPLHVPALLEQILHQHTPARGDEEEYAVDGFEQRVERTIIAGSLEFSFDKSLVYPSVVSDQSVIPVQPTCASTSPP